MMRPCTCVKCKARLGHLAWYVEAVKHGKVMPWDPQSPTIGILPVGVVVEKMK